MSLGTVSRRLARRLVWPAAAGLGYLLLPWAVLLGGETDVSLPVDSGLAVPEFGAVGTFFLSYQHGGSVTVTVPVSNDGPVPVTVSDVHLDLPDYSLVEESSTTGLPLELPPFADGSVELTLTYGNCRYYHERAVEEIDAARVAGTALGRSFERTVRLHRPLAVHAQVILDCPDRTLVRGDDVRVARTS